MAVINTTDMWSAAAMVVFVLSFSGVIVQTGWEHDRRSTEHKQIIDTIHTEMELTRKTNEQNLDVLICTAKLNLFFRALPQGQHVTWQDVPSEYWSCMPKNLIDERKR